MASDAKEEDTLSDQGLYLAAYRKLSEQPATTVRFFDKGGDGERYIVYNNDSQRAAEDVFKTNAVIKRSGSGSNKLEYVYLNRTQFETFVRDLLLVRQIRIEVYVNNESGRSGRIDWVVKFKGSPGNLTQFEDLLFSNNEMTVNNGVVGIKIGNLDRNKTIGIAHVNMNEWEIHLIEFVDNDALTNFESVLVQLSPKEAVFPVSASQTEDLAAVKKILTRNGVLINERKASDFDTKDISQDLGKLLKLKKGEAQNIAADPEMEKTLAVSGLAGVIKYLELMSGDMYLHQFKLTPFDFGLYVKMDSSACRALHLSLNSLEKSSKNDVTLLSVVDKCRTAQGHRLLAQYLKQPLMSKEKLEERLDLVQILFEDVILRQSLHEDHLRKVPDCQVISRKLLKNKATLQDCYRAYLFLSKMSKLMEDLDSHDGPQKQVLHSYFIEPLQALRSDLTTFSEMVNTTLDLEMADKGDFIVRSDFDDTFKDLRNQMDEIEGRMGDLTYKVAKSLDLDANKNLKLESNSQHGYFFRVTLKDEQAIRHNKEFEVIHSTKGGVNFRNSALESLSNQYSRLRATYEKEQKGIVEEVLGVASGYHSCFEQLGHIMSILDVITSFAFVAANSPTPFVRPKILSKGSGTVKFEGLRHPCVETQPDVNFIPNDIHFEQGKRSFYIITGPNMGGKSTYLRSIGVATLLAHVGCFVPASYAEVSIVDAILARVGAGDSLTKGVSTFMAEMIETSFILKTATSDSLVIIDELGRGTSTYDGFGLCWAISEHLAKKVSCYCVLATHFHELTSLADEVSTVVNYQVTAVADENGLTMLYKIEKGSCDRSFGIHVASHVDFPPDVIGRAKGMAKMLEDFSQEDDKDDDEIAVKRRRDYKIDGQKVIDDFLENLKALYNEQNCTKGESGFSDEAEKLFQLKIQEMYEDVNKKADENPYIKHLLKQSTLS